MFVCIWRPRLTSNKQFLNTEQYCVSCVKVTLIIFHIFRFNKNKLLWKQTCTWHKDSNAKTISRDSKIADRLQCVVFQFVWKWQQSNQNLLKLLENEIQRCAQLLSQCSLGNLMIRIYDIRFALITDWYIQQQNTS